MTTATVQKLKREIKQELIREFFLPLLEKTGDSEGAYRASFVRKILKAAKAKPLYKYDSKNFLKLVS